MCNCLTASFSRDVLTIYTPDKSSSLELARIDALEISSGLKGWLLRLDPTRVSIISNSRTRMVSVKVNELSQCLGIGPFEIILRRLFTFSFFEKMIEEKLIANNMSRIIRALTERQIRTFPHASGIKLSKKIYAYLPHSYLAIAEGRPGTRQFEYYQKVKNGSKDLVLGTGSFKKVKRLVSQNGKKMALATLKRISQNEDKEKFLDEIRSHENLKDISHVAQGRKISWTSAKGKVKEGLLMPEYRGTMETERHSVSFETKKMCALNIAKAVKSLMDKDLFHFDIKPANIFIDRIEGGQTHAYLGDLGGIRLFTSLFSDTKSWVKGLFGFEEERKNNVMQNGLEYTPLYMAPELSNSTFGVVYSKEGMRKAVIYSLGKTLLDWFRGEVNRDLDRILKQMVASKPDQRPSIEEVIKALEVRAF